ncbi:hypothetical protein [Mucilaginibacter sp.]
MKKNFLLIFLIFWVLNMYAQNKSLNIKTSDVSHKNYYSAISYLNEGEVDDNGKVYRVLICTSEIYDNVIIETLTVGGEGGNVKIISRRQIDIDGFWQSFKLTGEISGLKFIKWLKTNSFILEVQHNKFIFTNIGSTTPTISVLK